MFEELKKKNKNNQRLAELQHQTLQPRLAAEVDIKSDTKTCERTEGAAADGDKYVDILSAPANDPMRLTGFGDLAKPLALPVYRDDTLVDKSL